MIPMDRSSEVKGPQPKAVFASFTVRITVPPGAVGMEMLSSVEAELLQL